MEQFYQPLVEFINEQYALIDEGKTTSTISVFDIDDTILFAKSQIRYKEPGKSWASVGTSDFADVRHKLDPDTEYDFDDFTDYKKISMGMAGGKPNIPILKMMDKAIADGHKIGIITARGNQKAIWSSLNDFLLYRDKNDKLIPLPPNQFSKKYVFAVGDDATQKAFKDQVKGGSSDPSVIKAFILQKIFGDTMGFKSIIFFDDDKGNIKSVTDLKDPRIKAVKV